MNRATNLSSLSLINKIVVWVEDELSRAYLKELWDDGEIGFLVSGGGESLLAVVHAAQQQRIGNIFGVRDRDFRESNYAKWTDPTRNVKVFTLPAHEIENYLLDSDALAACPENTGKRTQTEIGASMQGHAEVLMPWMACRRAIQKLRDLFIADFPAHPTIQQVENQQDAENYILNTYWYQQLSERVASVTRSHVDSLVQSAHTKMQEYLNSGEWRVEFSGKEIFKGIRGWVHTAGGKGLSADVELAQSIAAWQRDKRRVPPHLNNLRSALRAKVGLP